MDTLDDVYEKLIIELIKANDRLPQFSIVDKMSLTREIYDLYKESRIEVDNLVTEIEAIKELIDKKQREIMK